MEPDRRDFYSGFIKILVVVVVIMMKSQSHDCKLPEANLIPELEDGDGQKVDIFSLK